MAPGSTLPSVAIAGNENFVRAKVAPQTVRNQPLENAGAHVSLNLLVDLLAVTEALIVFAAALISKFVYFEIGLQMAEPTLPYAYAGLVLAVLNYLVLKHAGHYEPASMKKRLHLDGKIFVAVALSFLLLLGLLYMFKVSEHYSRGWLVLWFALCAAGLLMSRTIGDLYTRLVVAEKRIQTRVAIYGTGATAESVRKELLARGQDYVLVGIFDNRDLSSGGLKELLALGQQDQIDEVIIALDPMDQGRLGGVAEVLAVLPIRVQYCSGFVRLPIATFGSQCVGDMHLLEVQRRPFSERSNLLKSFMDFFISGVALFLLAPLFAVIAVAIKLDSKGPVFFRQRRHGYNNAVFTVFKFRTMTVLEDGDSVQQAQRNDKRVTRVGKFLRRTSLDELPQLFNVILGQMSIVGPRPHAVSHNEYYSQRLEEYARRHRVKPGITGWAQVNGYRGETKDPEQMRERVKYDIVYINNWSLRFDLYIMMRTLLVVMTDKHAY